MICILHFLAYQDSFPCQVQELHEEEAQWVNYDEDELFVKMQLADGIFEALIRDTIQVLQGIQSKKNQTLHVWQNPCLVLMTTVIVDAPALFT